MAKLFRCPEQNDEFDFTLHWHREYELIYVQKGSLTVRKLDSENTLTDGDVYFMNSEEVHSYSGFDENSRFIVVNFPPKAIQPYFENPQDILTFKIEKGTLAFNKISTSLKALNECKNLEGRLETLKIRAILNNTCYYLIKYCRHPELTFIKGSDSEDFDCAKSAIIYMEKNYSKAIPLSEIADYVGMTPAHFSAYFKDKTEVTFSRYLRKIRLDHALEDMRKNNASVKAAALNNGFPNVNSLIITCKEEFGRTPLEMKHFAST